MHRESACKRLGRVAGKIDDHDSGKGGKPDISPGNNRTNHRVDHIWPLADAKMTMQTTVYPMRRCAKGALEALRDR